MTAERWQRISEIYESVIAHPPAGRDQVLDEACASDGDLRREVESLLKAREDAGTFLSPGDLRNHIRDLSEPEIAPGRTFGRYNILSIIGAGGMGEVYLARDTELGRPVALKVLPAQFTCDQERVARFRREARAASALSHPNIVTIYDIGETKETRYIAAEFIDGTTLRDRLTAGGVALQEALDIAIQCAGALAAAHSAGIVHRDIKPENIMLREDGVVKLVDFGLAGGSEAISKPLASTTVTGRVFGTPRYMSPEQARGQKLDALTDIFSLGAVLYEMTTGRPAFPGATAAEVFAALLGSAPGPPEEGARIVPDGLDTILAKALEKDREARYQTMAEFGAELRDFRDQRTRGALVGSSESRNSKTLRLLARSGAKGRRPAKNTGLRYPLAMLASALALAVVLGLLWSFRRAARKSPEAAPPMTVVPLTSFEGYKDFGSFSPDGKSIAFSWNGGQGEFSGLLERNIYLMKTGNSPPIRLTFAPQDETHATWSPDARHIAFCRILVDRPPFRRVAIYVVPAAGGTPRKIWVGSEGVSWSPDGKTLAVAGRPPEEGGIFLVALKTGKWTRLTRFKQYLDQLPIFSPDERWIAFTRSFDPSESDLAVVPSRGGAARQLTFDHQPIYGEAWTADSREIVFSSNRGSGGESLWRIPVTGGVPQRVSATLWGAFYPAISRQGNSLLYTEAYKDTNIYASDGAGFRGRFAPTGFTAPKLLIASSRRDDSASISPADGRIAFVSKRTGNEEIWVCDPNGGHLAKLTSFGGPATGTPRWSPDGRWIAFDSLAAGNPDIYVISPRGGAPRLLTSGPFGNFMPSWSPDGKRIYFKSDRSGTDQIWWVPARGGSATQLTRDGACEAFASPDGKLVYFTKRAWGPIWSVPADGGPEKAVPELARFNHIFRSWGVVPQGVYFISKEQGREQVVRFFSFATRQVTPLLTVRGNLIWSYPDVALSSDGRTLLIARLDQETDDLMLIRNFR